MKIRYLIKRKGKKGTPARVFIALYSDDQTELIYTGERVALKDWNKKERLPVNHDGELFQAIEKVKNAVLKVKRLMDANDEVVTPFGLKKAYVESTRQRTDVQAEKDKHDKAGMTTVASLIDQWIKVGLDDYQKSTRKVVVTSINMFGEYLRAAGLPRLERKELTSEIIADYSRWLETKKKLKDSTHGKKVKHLRWFLKFIKYDTAAIKEIKIRTIRPSERNIIHLTAAELSALEAVDVSYDYELQRAKDMWLLGAYTGLRVSDLKRINKHRIENGSLNITLIKNRKEVSIHLLREAIGILEKYDMGAPKISEQQCNEGIKKVCMKAGIDKIVYFKSKRAGQLIETKHPKHELITTHCAGKTFISLANDRWGLTPADVAATVGKDVKTVLGYYLKPDVERAKEKMIEAENRTKMVINR